MEHVDYMAVADKAMAQIKKGAFLTVKSGDDLNTMTIGWASLGVLWGRPAMTVMVRKSRHTYSIIERSSEYTVSVPSADLSKALSLCGQESGRKVDKFKACGLETMPSEIVSVPCIKASGLHFECRIVYKSAMDPAALVDSYKHLYPSKDYHTFYYGEIVNCGRV